ncbi:MAG: hypothetical protein NC084_05460 [Bacteroides sp.]|nr:hypothetical protein [Eubacterium sp.]MCM1418033.1 hypothetical protein [Roseburia sp.]MCM1462144.1 hypothetical protein [Bacteroides sp.]
MCKLFDDWTSEIKSFCERNGFDFEKAKKLSQCWGENELYLQYYDPNENSGLGLLDETPLPLVLSITKGPAGLVFGMTEHTRKYLM